MANVLEVLPFHSECLDDGPVEKFRAGEQIILPTTIRLGCGFHYQNIRHVLHLDLAYSIIDQYQEDSRGGRDEKACHAITFVQEDRQCPQDKGPYDLGVQAVWEWSRKDNQCLRIIPSQFLDGVPVTCDLIRGAQLCQYCQKERSKEPPSQPPLLPVRPILRLTDTPLVVSPSYGQPPETVQRPPTRTPYHPTSTSSSTTLSSAPIFQTPIRRVLSHTSDGSDIIGTSSPITMESPPPPFIPTFPNIDHPSPAPTKSPRKRYQLDPSMIFFPPPKRVKSTVEKDQQSREPVFR
jgi:hypothetical protein